jgi:hypothetical protein
MHSVKKSTAENDEQTPDGNEIAPEPPEAAMETETQL